MTSSYCSRCTFFFNIVQLLSGQLSIINARGVQYYKYCIAIQSPCLLIWLWIWPSFIYWTKYTVVKIKKIYAHEGNEIMTFELDWPEKVDQVKILLRCWSFTISYVHTILLCIYGTLDYDGVSTELCIRTIL